MRVPILTYHGVNVASDEYTGNDHIAFATDLALVHRLGLRIVPVQTVVDVLLGRADHDLSRCVALTCDDGTDLDYFDLDWPGRGRQRSFFNTLLDFRRVHGRAAQPGLHLTCFVIADFAARGAMDRACLFGQNWMGGRWWHAARNSGLVTIGNHSWDHNHPCLPGPGPHGLVRGDFYVVADEYQAEAEIAQAQEVLSGLAATLFCYPFGHVSEFLRADWLPRRGPDIGLDAAFGDGAAPVTMSSDRWNLPRYICGWHWKTPDALEAILRDAAG